MKQHPFSYICILLLAAGVGFVYADQSARQTDKAITVYKSPTCGCCKGWADYLSDNGFKVRIVNEPDLSILKSHYGIQPQLQSCHTAIVDGYAIEGHVPVDDIRRLLDERPNVTGLTAPGMPAMSPGMGSLQPKGYDVLTFDRGGHTTVYSRY